MTAIVILSLAILFWGINLSLHAIHLYKARQEVKLMLRSGLDTISPNYAFEILNGVNKDLSVIDRSLTWTYPILNLTGQRTSQVQPAVKYLKALSGYVLLFQPELAPLMELEIDNGFQMLDLVKDILQNETLLHQVIFYTEEIERYHSKLEISALPYRFQDDFQEIEPLIPLITSSGKILPLLPELAGIQQTSRYLLLAINHDELRGGGGFITAMGTASVNQLIQIDFDMQDSYQIDDFSKSYPLPPQPLQDYMLAGMWLPRDGNWSADYPLAAQNVQSLYELSTGVSTQGVIAFDQQAVINFLEVMGPIQVDADQNVRVDASNVLNFMYASWGNQADSQDWWANRKDFIGILGKAMVQNLINTRDYKKLILLGKTSQNLIQSGHLMVFFNDPIIQNTLAELQLDSSVHYQTGDFLYWVDSNIGYNKVDAVLLRHLSYKVDLTDLQNPKAHLKMEFQNPNQKGIPCVHEATYGQDIAYTNMFQRCYWDYWRVYTAPSTQLLNANIQFIPGEYLLGGRDWQGNLDLNSDLVGFGMVGGLQIVPTDTTNLIELEFSLSPDILTFDQNGAIYQLKIQKQLGLNELPLQLEVVLPTNYSFLQSPTNAVISKNKANFQINLTKTQENIMFSFSSNN